MPLTESPPQAPPVFNFTTTTILEDAKRIVDVTLKLREKLIADIPIQDATFENVCRPLALDSGEFESTGQVIRLIQACSPDSELRRVATEALQIMSKCYVENSENEEIFKRYEAARARGDPLDQQSKFLLDRACEDWIKAGMKLTDPELKARLKEIKLRISDLVIAFNTNLNEEKSCLWFAEDELKGVSKDLYSTWEKGTGENEGKLKLTFKAPTVRAVLQKADSAQTRMQVSANNRNRCAANLPIFVELVKLRDERARILGYPSHAHYHLSSLIAKTPEFVVSFLEDLKTKIRPAGEKEAKTLFELKKSLMSHTGQPTALDDNIFTWDSAYLRAKIMERDYQVDHDQIKEYFPVQTTLRKMLLIFEQLFQIEFVELDENDRQKISPTGKAADTIWHEDVDMFAVWDQESIGGEFIGYLYTDLHPREGKYYHNADFNLQQGFDAADGSHRYPATALICNLSKATNTRPGLLQHREVVTMFHELGHGIHDLLARTQYSRFHGYAVKRDFAEAPSQMLENWCWQPEQLQFLSCHWSHLSTAYEQEWKKNNPERNELPPKQLPRHLIDSLVASKRVHESLLTLRQLHFGLYDQKLHGPLAHGEMTDRDYVILYNKMEAEINCLAGPDKLGKGFDWGTGPATFGHIVSGYDGVYYNYLLSETWSCDMFHSQFAKNPMDSEVGMRYRRSILEKGGSRDELEGLTEFLGRPPSSEAFYRELGLA